MKIIKVLDTGTTYYFDGSEFACEHDNTAIKYEPYLTTLGPDGEEVECAVEYCLGCGEEVSDPVAPEPYDPNDEYHGEEDF